MKNITIKTAERPVATTPAAKNGGKPAKSKSKASKAPEFITVQIPIRQVISASKTGRTMVVGASRGPAGITINDREVFFTACAFYYPTDK